MGAIVLIAFVLAVGLAIASYGYLWYAGRDIPSPTDEDMLSVRDAEANDETVEEMLGKNARVLNLTERALSVGNLQLPAYSSSDEDMA